ncbi:MAG: hypothetical protein KJ792_02775 [Actinobacteria bacterium]|nr:hypothetical protein [Actinomycetota bacterium]MCG2800488.1 hypothetical protein [Cellulomonas sp.]
MSVMRGALSGLAASSVVAGGVTLALTTPPLSGGTLLGGGLVVAGGALLARLDLGPSEDAEPEAAEYCMVCAEAGPINFVCPHPGAHLPLSTRTRDANGEPLPEVPPECYGPDSVPLPVARMVHGPYRLDLLVMAERAREVRDETWALVDDVDDLRHSAEPEDDDAEALRTVAEHFRAAWVSLAAASTALQEMTKP